MEFEDWRGGTWKHSVSPTWKVSEPFLWGFIVISLQGMIDKISGCW